MNNLSELLGKNNIPVKENGTCGTINQKDCFYHTIHGSECVRAWEIARAESDMIPIIFPANFNNGDIISNDIRQIQADLASVGDIALPSWFEEQWGDYDFENEDEELEEMFEEFGKTPGEPVPVHSFMLPYEVGTDTPHSEMWLVTIPCPHFYEIPVYMQYGGWNACPYPAEHAAVLKYWNKKYGAEFFGISGDVIELKVSEPPLTYEDAFVLAKEQMAYCDDIVFQGTMTVERLAKTLVGSTAWFFWWD